MSLSTISWKLIPNRPQTPQSNVPPGSAGQNLISRCRRADVLSSVADSKPAYDWAIVCMSRQYVHKNIRPCIINRMGKKRLVIDLDEVDHAALVKKARRAEMTVAN